MQTQTENKVLLNNLLSSLGIGLDIDPLTGVEVDGGLVSVGVEPLGSTNVGFAGSELADVDLSEGVAVGTLDSEVDVSTEGVAVGTLDSEIDVSTEGVAVGIGEEIDIDLTEGVGIDIGDLIQFAFDTPSEI